MSIPASGEQESRDRTKRLLIFVLGGWNMFSWILNLSGIPRENWGENLKWYVIAHFLMVLLIQPLLSAPALWLAYKNQRLTLASWLVAIPWLFYLAGVFAFGIGVAIYGF